ncbi:RDD family protein [Aestuariibacter sp. AA17]|uniref:RDD family protein n=1 Tax=Fluctibacter corallii TaxID=2984329 RepID=A0ABT3A9N1_9ALTE|nr:RDD family protein [Aestuariibacter sp. AA17]MCV2885385.1 RDD family protein [Aestuariibacter sp. AA17]
MQGSEVNILHIGKGKETREVVTPQAFSVSDDLIGRALATPLQRAGALLLDLLLVLILTDVSPVFLAGFVAVMFFRAGNRLKLKKNYNALRLFLRFMTATLLFVFAIGLFDALVGPQDPPSKPQSSRSDVLVVDSEDTAARNVAVTDAIELLAYSAKYKQSVKDIPNRITHGECASEAACYETALFEFGELIAELDLPLPTRKSLVADELNDVEQVFSASDRERIQGDLYQLLTSKHEEKIADINPQEDATVQEREAEEQDDTFGYSLVQWAKGIAGDLGLGFGWAALYFTAFTTWLGGYTPGKKVFGIKVVKLDGSAMNLWESFGRYGGYGAGIATGLLGFLQLMWDPNRQAIQDKISETLVINTRKSKVKVEYIDSQSPQSASQSLVKS